MSDYSELKRVAEESVGFCDVPIAPDVVLGLIYEVEGLRAQHGRDSAELRSLCQARDDARKERDQLKAEVERLKNRLEVDPRHDYDGISTRDATVKVLDEQVDQLKAENERLKAESEALRDDIEQNQYDANAWRNGEESVWIEVFNSEGDDPFISAITGQITVEQLALIQSEILEYREDYFEKGSGLYVFRCAHYQAHYDNVGMTEPAHWETDFESYIPFPWEEEAAAMGKGEQS